MKIFGVFFFFLALLIIPTLWIVISRQLGYYMSYRRSRLYRALLHVVCSTIMLFLFACAYVHLAENSATAKHWAKVEYRKEKKLKKEKAFRLEIERNKQLLRQRDSLSNRRANSLS